LTKSTRAATGSAITLGPEPLIEPQSVAVSSMLAPSQPLWVVTDGLRPFKVQNTAVWVGP
jgi:general secretion pathway protein H